MGIISRMDHLSLKLGFSVAGLVMVAHAVGFFLIHDYYFDNTVEMIREHAQIETRLILNGLEHQMLNKDDTLIAEMVENFARDRSVQRVMILDRRGNLKFTSDQNIEKSSLSEGSPTCQVCHRLAPEERQRSVTLEFEREKVLRCVEPIPNRPVCHSCHDPAHKLNGLIVVDVSLAEKTDSLERSIQRLALGTGGLSLFLLVSIGLVFRRLVLRRLGKFQEAARAIGRGQLSMRLPAGGRDSLGGLERQFNQMADSVDKLLAELRQQTANLERVMNSVDEGIVVLDRNRIIVAANGAFWRRFGDKGQVRVGRSCCNQGAERGRCGIGSCPALKCFSEGEVQTIIGTRRREDGSERLEEVRAAPVFQDDGEVLHVVEVWRDITDRRTAEARLAEYERMVSLGRLASGFSHEVNTPLASIGTCLDGITRMSSVETTITIEDTSQILEYARIASTQVQRCGDITKQFLQLARGKSLGDDVVDLNESVAITIRLLKAISRGFHVDVISRLPEILPKVLASEAAVQQVLLNLVMNALEASEEGAKVEIYGAVTADGVELCVSDNGQGIPPENIGQIFEPFFTGREKGTGLGLFVTMNLVQSWGGDVRVDSKLGDGAKFTVQFPNTREETEAADDSS